VRETSQPLSVPHGRHALEGLAGVTGAELSLITKDPELAYFDLSRTVFLDTETTGLGTGTGTKVFLVGAGYLDGSNFRVRQFFLNALAEEFEYLSGLGSFLQRFSTIVTFNGKAFDWPLLEQRYVYHRELRRPPLLNPLHIDLLHPARRIWKPRLESCALSSLETHILGLKRAQDDVPGYLIPSMYFRYIRTGDGRSLRGVFYHNLHDILSLATLTIHIGGVIRDPLGGMLEHALDFLSLGKAFDRAGEAELAASCYEEALRRGLHVDYRVACLAALGAVQKRQRWWEPAMQTWYRLLDDGGPGALHALVEMSKYFEHVERDYAQALDCVRQAIALDELQMRDSREPGIDDLERRLSRLVGRSLRHHDRF
jgi:uncharacterized protein YprB with RNaseH-like and TPR domain